METSFSKLSKAKSINSLHTYRKKTLLQQRKTHLSSTYRPSNQRHHRQNLNSKQKTNVSILDQSQSMEIYCPNLSLLKKQNIQKIQKSLNQRFYIKDNYNLQKANKQFQQTQKTNKQSQQSQSNTNIHIKDRNNTLKVVPNKLNKQKHKLRKKAYFKIDQPCVGTYDTKPQLLMKKLTRNQLFRKQTSCHASLDNKQNTFRQTTITYKQKISKKCETLRLKSSSSMRNSKQLQVSPSLLTKTFDMSRQVARTRQKFTHKNKLSQQIAFQWQQKRYNKSLFLSTPFNHSELVNLYTKQREKYRIPECNILNNIKLGDFIRATRREEQQDQNNDDN